MADKGVMPTEKMDSSKILGTFTFKPMDDVAWYVQSHLRVLRSLASFVEDTVT